jgi:hypothetical protein
MIEEIESFVVTLGFPIAIVCYLLWERHKTMCHFETVIKKDLVGAINNLKLEIVKLNERCDGNGRYK